MDAIVLRGRMTPDGKIELLDPLPKDFDASGEISVILSEKLLVYESINEYEDHVIVDELEGSVSPVDPLTTEELLKSPLIGIWADRKDEIGDASEWVRNLRQNETTRRWRERR